MKQDAELLAAARTDPAAFRALYDRYAERVSRFHLSRTRDPETALDLTAETFAQAWLARGRFRDEAGGSAAPWLLGIARHVLLASVRHRRLEQAARRRLGLLRPEPTREPEPRWLDGLDEALAELGQVQRQTLALRVLEGLPYDEVARRLGTTPAAARVRVHRALRQLRSRLTTAKETTP